MSSLSVSDLMENNWLSLWPPDGTDLVSLSTGSNAPPDGTRELLSKVRRLTRFSDEQAFLNSLTRRPNKGLKTFSHINTKQSQWKKGKDVVLKADRNLFCHLTRFAESREVNTRDVLAHPLGPLLWALANADGR